MPHASVFKFDIKRKKSFMRPMSIYKKEKKSECENLYPLLSQAFVRNEEQPVLMYVSTEKYILNILLPIYNKKYNICINLNIKLSPS